MTYRENIQELFARSQAVLQEYSALCLKMQNSQKTDALLLQECDRKFREYNKIIAEHHELIMSVTRGKVKLDDKVIA